MSHLRYNVKWLFSFFQAFFKHFVKIQFFNFFRNPLTGFDFEISIRNLLFYKRMSIYLKKWLKSHKKWFFFPSGRRISVYLMPFCIQLVYPSGNKSYNIDNQWLKIILLWGRTSQARILLLWLENQSHTMYFVDDFFFRVPTRVPTKTSKNRWFSQNFTKGY